MDDLYKTMVNGMDEDERLVLLSDYIKTPYIYDKFSGYMYLVTLTNRKGPTIVSSWGLRRLNQEILAIHKTLVIVRPVPPKHKNLPTGDFIHSEDYYMTKDRYVVLGVWVSAIHESDPNSIHFLSKEDAERLGETPEWTLLDTVYQVRTKGHNR